MINFDTSMFSYDSLRMLFKYDYDVKDLGGNVLLKIHQPTIGDIVEMGEKEYYNMISTLCVSATDMKVLLWDAGKDWNKILDFELFATVSQQLPKSKTSILFGDLDFQKFQLYRSNDDQKELVMHNPDINLTINEYLYAQIVWYLRKLHGLSYNNRKVKGKLAKRAVIDAEKADMRTRKDEVKKSDFQNIISSMLVYPGFKYKSSELKECGIYEFMDAVKRAQIYVSTNALIHGAYSGFMDTKSINKKEFDWMREVV